MEIQAFMGLDRGGLLRGNRKQEGPCSEDWFGFKIFFFFILYSLVYMSIKIYRALQSIPTSHKKGEAYIKDKYRCL